MRKGVIAVAICALCACSNASSGGGSKAPPADAGTPFQPDDGGTTAPPDDGGTTAPADDGGMTAPPDDGGTIVGPPDGGGAPDGGASADCDGIVPRSLGASVSAQVTVLPPEPGSTCPDATSDESGNVAAGLIFSQSQPSGRFFGNWQFFSKDGRSTGSVNQIVGDLFPQGVGFEGTRGDGGPSVDRFVRVLPDGTRQDGTTVGGDEAPDRSFRGWPNGLWVVTTSCQLPGGNLAVQRFGPDGALLARQASTGGCVRIVAGAGGPGGVALFLFWTGATSEIAGIPANTVFGRWFDGNANPLSAPFTVATSATVPDMILRTLVTGEIALRSGGHWLGVFDASGGMTLKSAPSWLKDDEDFTIIRGQRAYASIPRTGSLNHLDLVSVKGNLCGTVTFPGVQGLTTGADGTVIGASGKDGCTKTWWSGLLK